jgi:hypothetical protein
MNKAQFIFGIIVGLVLTLLVCNLCCCGFRPYTNKDMTPEYNMAINAMKLADSTKNTSIAVEPMKNYYSSLNRDKCRKEIFGVDEKGNINPVDYNDAKKYRDYNECLKELK